MDGLEIAAHILNRFCRVALALLILYLGWAIVGDRPFVAASNYVSSYLASSGARVGKPASPDGGLIQADALREISRRSRRLAETIGSDGDRRRLSFYADELDESARRMEKEASATKPLAMTPAALAPR